MSPQGMVPIQARLQAVSFEEALKKFPEAMKQALDAMVEDAKKRQQEQGRTRKQEDSRIILPGS